MNSALVKKVADWNLRLISGALPHPDRLPLLGDFLEILEYDLRKRSALAATGRFQAQILRSLPLILTYVFVWRIIMFGSYFRSAFRNIRKYKGFSFINIVGLALGMTVCILILLYVQDEMSYDSFHTYQDRIFRIERVYRRADGSLSGGFSTLAPSFVPALEADFPEIEHAARMYQLRQAMFTLGVRSFVEERIFFAEDDIFEIFKIPLIQGDPSQVLTNPFQAVITQTMAEKYFGNENPLGKQLIMDGQFPLQISGIMKELPTQSHIHFDFLISYKSLCGLYGQGENDYFCGSTNFTDNVTLVYARLAETADPEDILERVPEFLDRNLPARPNDQGEVIKPSQGNHLYFRKVRDIHLHPHPFNEVEPGSDILYVRLFTFIALFILIIACINFTNLSTARATQRAREVGLRKVVGAHRRMLIFQFLSESFLIALTALILAVFAVILIAPYFSSFTGHILSLSLGDPLHVVGIIVLLLITGLTAGLYPAVYMSLFDPAVILRGEMTRGKRGAAFRKILVVFQFTVSAALMIAVGVVFRQMRYIDSMDLGYDRENIVMVPADPALLEHWPDLKFRLKNHPGIDQVALSKRAPTGRLGDAPGFSIEINGETQRTPFHMPHNRVEHDFFRTYGMKIIAGRDFSTEFPTDSLEAFIINEEAVRRLGLEKPEDALDLPIGVPGRQGRIIGVVRDFHYEPVHVPVKAIITYIRPQEGNTIAVRVKKGYIQEALDYLRTTIESEVPGHPLNASFLDDRIDALYRNEERMMIMFGYFCLLAIFIACLGLFGLASFTAERKTKEIGIRKVMGASISTIVYVLSRDFLKWVLIANVIAWPIAWYAMSRWLQSFAYQTNVGYGVFVFALFLSVIIATGTVSFQSIRAAQANPVEALKYE